jgi:hypothetical protein
MPIKHQLVGLSLLALTSILGAAAQAATFNVLAQANSSTGGIGAATVTLVAGESYSVSVNPSDIWSAGPLPRWSNADGLITTLIATGTDESGEAAGTVIGVDTPLWTQDGLTAPFGALVGRIGVGSFFVIGTSFSGTATTSGVLQLFYWDLNNEDNTDAIAANITTSEVGGVPLPGALPLFATGLGAIGLLTWRRKRNAVAA